MLSDEGRTQVLTLFWNMPGCEWVLEDMEDEDLPFVAILFRIWFSVPLTD